MGQEDIRDAFTAQGQACTALGSPFMAGLMPLIGARLDRRTAVGRHVLDWQGDVGPSGQSVPLRLAGALHGLVLEGAAPELAAVYPPRDVPGDALWAAIEAALQAHEARILDWLTRAPQTNELRRAAAVAAGIWWALGVAGARPVVLSELGASAGLNLALDRFAVELDGQAFGAAEPVITLSPQWRGDLRPAPQPFDVVQRGGVDLAPLDPSDAGDALRLLAYLWPDQPERLARTRAAIAAADMRPEAGDAAPWLAQRLEQEFPGALHVIYSTIAAQYFPTSTSRAIARSLCQAGAAATAQAPVLHLSLEADGKAPGAALSATLWRGGGPEQMHLARAGFHVDWIDWAPHAPKAPFYPL
ncbi:MAG: DUF2332 domain-containing protein [Sulfitobacter sp.]